MKELEFYQCEDCGEIKVEFVENQSKECGSTMSLLIPNTVDAATEKHVPVAKLEGDLLHVEVGSILHPMTEEHLINAIHIVTDHGVYIAKELTAKDEPKYTFKIDDANVIDVYAVCNLHGVWKTTVKR